MAGALRARRPGTRRFWRTENDEAYACHRASPESAPPYQRPQPRGSWGGGDAGGGGGPTVTGRGPAVAAAAPRERERRPWRPCRRRGGPSGLLLHDTSKAQPAPAGRAAAAPVSPRPQPLPPLPWPPLLRNHFAHARPPNLRLARGLDVHDEAQLDESRRAAVEHAQ